MSSQTSQPSTEALTQRDQRLEPPSLILLLLGILFLIGSGYLWSQWLQVRSRESVLEVRTLTLRTPIDGIITSLRVNAGSPTRRGESLFAVENDKVPRPRLGDLRLQITAATARLELLRQKLSRTERLVSEATEDLELQSRLQVARHQQELQSLLKRRQKSVKEWQFLQRDVHRKRYLFRLGAMAYDQVDRAETSANQEAQETRAIDSQIKAQRSILEAAQNNLTLIATRGGADPEARLRDEQQRLLETRDEYEAQRQQVKSLKQQLLASQRDQQLLTEANVRSPLDGVVWRVDAFAGSSVQRQAPILQLLDCRQRWINTYVKETDLRKLRIGQRALITLYGSSATLRGSIALIRSGIGRSSTGSDAPPLLPINIYREAQVKVAIDPHTVLKEDPRHLCYSGYTGKVSFLSEAEHKGTR